MGAGFIFTPYGQYHQVVNRYGNKPQNKENRSIRTECVVKEKLPGHPGTVGAYPQRNGYVMKQVGNIIPAAPGNVYTNQQSGYYHGHTRYFKIHYPATVL